MPEMKKAPSLFDRIFGDAPSYSELANAVVELTEQLEKERAERREEQEKRKQVDREIVGERRRMLEALRFYADRSNWRPHGLAVFDGSPARLPAHVDGGKRARKLVGDT